MPNTSSRVGLYHPFLTPQEIRDHQALPPGDLTSEINLLRVMTARYLGWLQASSSGEIVVTGTVLRSLSRLMGQLATVLAAHIKLNPPLTAIADEIDEGLNLTRLLFGILDPREVPSSSSPVASGLSPPW